MTTDATHYARNRWMIAGWVIVALATVGWCLANLVWSEQWKNDWVPAIPQGQTWTGRDTQLTVNTVLTSTTITVPDQDPILATEGASFVLVTIDYTQVGDGSDRCSMTLVGDGREWTQSFKAFVGDVVPGVVTSCNQTDENGNLIPTGTTGVLFEIPTSALDEIRGVRVSVFYAFDILASDRNPADVALLEAKPKD